SRARLPRLAALVRAAARVPAVEAGLVIRVTPFDEMVERRTRAALAVRIEPLDTLADRSAHFPDLQPIGTAWTRRLYDGPFHLFPPADDLPAVSLVFVQSREGNTVADNPDDLGGGPTDKHLIYEGLTRVAADAVLSGAVTAASTSAFFSVWHPEIVALRAALGLPRHPVQIVISGTGAFPIGRALICNVPEVRAIILTGASTAERL